MKGLLHRLAQRAAGTAATVRSDAALPFGAEVQRWQTEPPAPQGQVPAAEVLAAQPAVLPVRSPAQPPAPSIAPPASAAPPDVSAPAHAAHNDAASTAPALPASAAARHEPEPTDPGRPAAAALQPLVAAQAGLPLSAVRESAPTEEPAAVVAPVSQPPEPAVGPRAEPPPHAAAPAAEPASPLRAADRWPAPLRPATAPLPVLPAAPATVGRGPRSAVAAPPPPGNDPAEVHIHIGRIEVTALPQAAAPRARPPARTPAQSLDAYLALRGGK